MSQPQNIDKSDGSFRSRIWDLCCQRGLTVAELAAAAGLHRATIWHWLKGTSRPSQKSLIKLYKAGLDPLPEDL